jgi:oxygen-independent coproporphyrinogen-3 oxidase
MAGIYIHIPFCKTRCSYCDFHSGTNFKLKHKLVDALCREIELRKDYLNNETIQTIYFGGGTPSLLEKEDLFNITNAIHFHFDTTQCAEMTIEANPDDLTEEYVRMLKSFHFNRISIGIQSFDNKELSLINRRHSAEKAIEAVKICQENGFDNISIDLIYGLPSQTLETWRENLHQAIQLNVQHISAYHLTYEKGTLIYKLARQKEIVPVNEDTSIDMFKGLISTLEDADFEQYEISNFSKKGFRSQHNSSYWNEKKYIGIGPSAHSYDINSRQWNIDNTQKYITAIEKGLSFFNKEILTNEEKYNDFIITKLRTKEGINLSELEKFGEKLQQYCIKNTQKWIKNGQLIIDNKQLALTKSGIFVSDSIFSDLIWINNS